MPRERVNGQCKVDGCTEDNRIKGYCTKHYHRARYVEKNGLPQEAIMLVRACRKHGNDLEEVLELRVRQEGGRKCWVWQGAKNGEGYGSICWNGKIRSIHRVVYENLVGEIPAGKEIDHLCRNTSCCNPEHLDVVTAKENTRRSKLTNGEHWNLRFLRKGNRIDERESLQDV